MKILLCMLQCRFFFLKYFYAEFAHDMISHLEFILNAGAYLFSAAAEFGTCMILSSWSTCSVEDVSNAAPRGLRWFQLYIYKDRNVVIDLVKRAEKAGYQALAVTVDTPILGQRRNDVRHKFALPSEFSLANYKKDDSHSEGVHSDKDSGLAAYVKNLIDPSLSWKDIDWLRTITSLPILLKGVLTKEAAIEAVKHGIGGIIVSNHGARQLDGVTSTVSPSMYYLLPLVCFLESELNRRPYAT